MEPNVELTLPDWLLALARTDLRIETEEERVDFVVELSRRNVVERTGGPFSAAVFQVGGRLVAAGVSRVEPLACSIAHAEVMAIAFAQHRMGRFDLGARGFPLHELVSSAQPCLMCTGATLWCGVRRLVYAAHKSDVEGLLGFDEGPVPEGWQMALRGRGIEVSTGSQAARSAACRALELYRTSGGLVYNGRGGSAASSH